MNFKNFIIFLLKLSVAFIILWWMIQSGKLDIKKLSLLIIYKELSLYIGLLWILGFVIMGSFRWYLLLRGVDIKANYIKVMILHSIGLFFNTAMPGAVGGDIIKAYYVIKDNSIQTKTPAALSVLLDRVLGIMGLFILGLTSLILNFTTLWHNPLLKPIASFIIMFCICTLIFFILVFMPIKNQNNFILKITSDKIFCLSILKKIYLALRSYKNKPWHLINALLLSIVIQTATMLIYIKITEKLNNIHVSIIEYATIFPIGILTTAIPITPGGLGIGHVAFEKLYELINLKNGANVFNLFFIENILLNCIGIIPYLLLKPNNIKNDL